MTHLPPKSFVLRSFNVLITVLLVAGAIGPSRQATAFDDGPFMLKEMNPSPIESGTMQYPVVLGDLLLFKANDPTNGNELWRSDGTVEGTYMLKDINPSGSSNPKNLTKVGNIVFFAASNGTDDEELWKTNGTPGGTVMVKNINLSSWSAPQHLFNFNGTLLFSADDGTNGRELWKSGGTSGTTSMVKNINTGSAGADPSNPQNFVLWVHGGTPTVFFQAKNASTGIELYRTDLTITTIDEDINKSGSNSSSPTGLMVLTNNTFCPSGCLLFAADDDIEGVELFRRDTSGNVNRIADIFPGGGDDDSSPAFMTQFKGRAYFAATSNGGGRELWYTDGNIVTPMGNISSGSSNPSYLIVLGDELLFSADDGVEGIELWKTDGVTNKIGTGTKQIKDINPGTPDSIPLFPTLLLGKVYFSAKSATHGKEIWVTDGTKAGTVELGDIAPGSEDSTPISLIAFKNGLYFSATDKVDPWNWELWVYEPNQIFADGFESGDISAWSGAVNASIDNDFDAKAGCILCVNASSSISGDFDLQVLVINRKPHFLKDTNPTNLKRYRARFYIDTSSLNIKKGGFMLMQAVKGKKKPFQLQVRRYLKKYQIRAIIRTDGGKNLKTKWSRLPKTSTLIEIDWKAAATRAKHNGYIKLYINDSLAKKKVKVNNDTYKVETIKLGIAKRIKSTHNLSGAFYLDSFDSDKKYYLGP